jgi:erythromycin esterase-like protein
MVMPNPTMSTAQSIREAVHPLWNEPDAFDPLLNEIGNRRFVLIGEASHGTHEFYATRAQITRRLIQEKGFTAVIVEADWPDAYRVNRYVRGFHDDENADQALSGFKRFPQWMWRNKDVLEFVSWLRAYNDSLKQGETKTGFYGMDLYSLYASIAAVLEYLDPLDHAAAIRARYRYACFEHFAEDPQSYGYAAGFDLGRSCEDVVVQQLMDLRRHANQYTARDGLMAEDEFFAAEQNARLIKNAEKYYRSMFRGRVSSWNLRDQHMAETICALVEFLDQHQTRTKIVVWAHNSHLGDARATEMSAAGELNVGQLLRQKYGQNVFITGFTTHAGTVTAASDWDAPAQVKEVRPSLSGSYERLFHDVQVPQFLMSLGAGGRAAELLRDPRLERAIGVIYRPQTERMSHYFQAALPQQFDAVIHWDQTRAVEPLEVFPAPETHEVEETFPTGV